MADQQVQPAQTGLSAVKLSDVSHKPFNTGPIRSEMLCGLLKGEFIEQLRWNRLKETAEGLVIMCWSLGWGVVRVAFRKFSLARANLLLRGRPNKVVRNSNLIIRDG